MSTSIRSEATRSVVVVNGVDTMSINQDGSVELLVPNNTPTGNDIVSAINFDSSLSTSGYQKLPSGLIIQWGFVPSSTSNSLIWPISFPNICFAVVASGADNGGVQGRNNFRAYGVNGCTCSVEVATRYVAIGY